MNENNSVVAVYASHTTAEAAIKELQRSGFDMKTANLSWNGLLGLKI